MITRTADTKHRRNRRRLAKVLRSGKYEQATGRLCKAPPNGEYAAYCCLGVAYDQFADDADWVYVSAGWRLRDDTGTHWHGKASPRFMRETFGFIKADLETLIRLNDRQRYTFEQIARVIEVSCA